MEKLIEAYIGDPLVPEYSSFNEESDEKKQEEFSNKLKDGCLLFRNSFEGYEIIDSLESFGIENWNFYNCGPTIDGSNYDFAFFTKDKEGNEKIYRYQFMESSLKDEYVDFFHKLFDVVSINELEIVTINEEMTRQSNKKLPGNCIQD